MIGGLFVDALLLASVLAFGWAGRQLGGIASMSRTLSSFVALAVAMLVRDPLGELVQLALSASDDFCNLFAVLLAGAATYAAMMSLCRWWQSRRAARRIGAGYDELDADPLDNAVVGAVAGGALGALWAVGFIALLVLLPADNVISRSAVRSATGGVLISTEGGLRWLHEGFPHYTQTLPKGEGGVVVGERDPLPMRGRVETTAKQADADVLLRSINAMRLAKGVPVLTYNPRVSRVARRHAEALAAERALAYRTPGGGPLDARVSSALGESAGSFDPKVGVEVAWAHTAANAARGLAEDPRAAELVTQERWSEIGIGVIDTGWFNGRIYVLVLIGPDPDADDGDAGDGAEGAGGDGAVATDALLGTDLGDDVAALRDGAPADAAATGACAPAEPSDLDGDGTPDAESVDPSLADC